MSFSLVHDNEPSRHGRDGNSVPLPRFYCDELHDQTHDSFVVQRCVGYHRNLPAVPAGLKHKREIR
jgi:hypothetical protein